MIGRVLEESAPMDTGGHNILASWAVAVAQAADARGLDSEAIFTRAGIDLSTARDPKTRFPAERMTVVYRLAEEAVHDLTFGLSIAEFVHPTSLHALGYSLFASSDLESFCRRIVRYFGLVTTNAVTHYEERGTECRLVMYPETGANIFAPQDAWLATILRFRTVHLPARFRSRASGVAKARAGHQSRKVFGVLWSADRVWSRDERSGVRPR